MKKIILTLHLLLSIALFSEAQDIYRMLMAVDFFKMYKMEASSYKDANSTIKGSPYLNDDFINGTIYTYSKAQFNNVPLRYNIYNDEIEFKDSKEQILAMATPEIVEKAVFDKHTMSYVEYKTSKKIKHGFLNLIAEGEASLYARFSIFYKKAEKEAPYKDPEPAKFIKKPKVYYISINKAPALKVGKKKELPSLFPSHQKELARFIKKNKIKTNKVEDLKKLVSYYNSLE